MPRDPLVTRVSPRRAELAMAVVALCWGLSFPMIKVALRDATPLAFMALRFPLALLILWPLMGRRPAAASLFPGLVLALLLGGAFFAQVAGLVYTTPTRSAFITGLSVILVPLLYPVFIRRFPAPLPLLGAGLAAVGLFLVTQPEEGGFNRGDGLTLFCAVAYAIYIIALEVAAKKCPYEDLVLIQVLVLSVIFLPGALVESAPLRVSGNLIWGLVTTAPILALTLFLQNRYQQYTTATRAAVIFTSEPVFAGGFSFLIFGEALAGLQWAGAALILLGILAAVRH